MKNKISKDIQLLVNDYEFLIKGIDIKVDKPIHNPKYYKSLRSKNLLGALEVIKRLL